MYPSPQGLRLDVESISGILGSISIACWVVVFSPQIIENFRRSSADGLSLSFIVIWLVGDIFNILGAVLQGVLPTMIILAVYYTLADIVLLLQCFYYRGFTLSDTSTVPSQNVPRISGPDEESPLLNRTDSYTGLRTPEHENLRRTSSSTSFASLLNEHLSPATPLLPPPRRPSEAPAARNLKPASTIQAVIFNTSALFLVCLAGVFGWWLSTRSAHNPWGESRPSPHKPSQKNSFFSALGSSSAADNGDGLVFDFYGQIFGWLCAVLYLASRVPQLILNYRRKSTEGVSMLFFLFACVGNLTYVLSILAYEPACAKIEGQNSVFGALASKGGRDIVGCEDGEWASQYLKYFLVNLSWLVGSAGTLGLDGAIFVQFWMYSGNEPSDAFA